MKRTKIIVAVALSALVIIIPAAAQLSSPKIDSLMETALKGLNVAGAAIAVVKDGKVIHQKGYGYISLDTKLPVNASSNFQIASNSKSFTTAALAILVDEGKIKWDDKVKDYIPEFRMYNEYVTDNFNIVDLLTHRSGLGIGAGDLMFIPDGADFTVKDVINIFQYFKPVSAFRTRYNYDNLLYIIAGEIIARVSGMPYNSFTQKRILEPIQMTHSFVGNPEDHNKDNLAVPHAPVSGILKTIKPFDIGMISPAGGVYSNVSDMAKWMIMQLNKGKYGDDLKKALFSSSNSSKMWTIQTVLPSYLSERYHTHFNGYGLGWILNDMRGNLVAQHTGGLPGMQSQVVLVTDLNLGVVILTNSDGGGGSLGFSVCRTIVDSYLGLDAYDWLGKSIEGKMKGITYVDSVTNNVWEKVKVVKNTKVNPENYIGIYEDKWFGKMEVFLKGKQLWIKSLRSPKLNGPLAFYNANSFAVKWEYQDMNCDAFAMFTLDENGKAQSFKLKGISPYIDFSFDFQDLDMKRVRTK